MEVDGGGSTGIWVPGPFDLLLARLPSPLHTQAQGSTLLFPGQEYKSGFSRETELMGYTYNKELAQVVMEANHPQLCGVGWQSGDSEGQMFQFKCKGCLLEKSLLLGEAPGGRGVWSFCAIQAFN